MSDEQHLPNTAHDPAAWRQPPPGSKPSWFDRVFDDGAAARKGCGATAIVAVVGLGLLTAYCTTERLHEEARAAEQAKVDKAKRDADYQRSLADGSVCADGWGGSNIRLTENVMAALRDPDSFKHERTVISKRSPTGDYFAVMQYRAKNGFGGYTRGTVAAALGVAEGGVCYVKQMREVE